MEATIADARYNQDVRDGQSRTSATKEVMMSLRFDANGDVEMIYKDDAVPFMEQLGTIETVTRASHVEWEDGGWTVRAAHDTELAVRYDDDGNLVASREGTIAVFAKRADALREEVNAIWNLVPA